MPPLLTLVFAAPAPAIAAPQAGFTAGVVVSHGADSGTPYTSYAPMGTLTTTWRLGPFEAPVGIALSGLVVSDRREARPGMPLQIEAGFGVGSPTLAAGIYTGGGIGQTAGGLYARWLFVEERDHALGVEARAFGLWPSGDQGFALLARADIGGFSPPARRPAHDGPVITATPRDDVVIPPREDDEDEDRDDDRDEDDRDEDDGDDSGAAPIHHGDPYGDPE